MVDKKPLVVSEVYPVMSKGTYHKFNGLNYLGWNGTIHLYLRSIGMDNHLMEDPPTNDSRQKWMRGECLSFLANSQFH